MFPYTAGRKREREKKEENVTRLRRLTLLRSYASRHAGVQLRSRSQCCTCTTVRARGCICDSLHLCAPPLSVRRVVFGCSYRSITAKEAARRVGCVALGEGISSAGPVARYPLRKPGLSGICYNASTCKILNVSGILRILPGKFETTTTRIARRESEIFTRVIKPSPSKYRNIRSSEVFSFPTSALAARENFRKYPTFDSRNFQYREVPGKTKLPLFRQSRELATTTVTPLHRNSPAICIERSRSQHARATAASATILRLP